MTDQVKFGNIIVLRIEYKNVRLDRVRVYHLNLSIFSDIPE